MQRVVCADNGGWNVIGCESFINQPILQYSNEIRNFEMTDCGERVDYGS